MRFSAPAGFEPAIRPAAGDIVSDAEATRVILDVQGLTKSFAGLTAVDHVSFQVGPGEVVGLLGPNGAGKSTTMRMIAGAMPPTDGSARVAGFDVFEHPLDVRRLIGYMPESNPLYTELRVSEYLHFRARLKEVPRRARVERVHGCIERCALGEVRRQVIRTLSKGYRQRVGLADAMLAEPRLLILDEPTIGLDPNQIRQTRQTIREIGRHHAILLSTHILQEVEAVCSRVLIIDHGRILADDTPAHLAGRIHAGAVEAELRATEAEACGALGLLDGVGRVDVLERGEWLRLCVVPADAGRDLREAVGALAAARGWPLRELGRRRATLEEVFHRITLADEADA